MAKKRKTEKQRLIDKVKSYDVLPAVNAATMRPATPGPLSEWQKMCLESQSVCKAADLVKAGIIEMLETGEQSFDLYDRVKK